jgi:hypothetical protein
MHTGIVKACRRRRAPANEADFTGDSAAKRYDTTEDLQRCAAFAGSSITGPASGVPVYSFDRV